MNEAQNKPQWWPENVTYKRREEKWSDTAHPCDGMWRDEMRRDETMWYDMRANMMWLDTVRYDVTRYDTVWYGMMAHDLWRSKIKWEKNKIK